MKLQSMLQTVFALRANTPLAQGLNEMTRKFPWTRLFFPFPGTQANIFNIVDETPRNAVPFFPTGHQSTSLYING